MLNTMRNFAIYVQILMFVSSSLAKLGDKCNVSLMWGCDGSVEVCVQIKSGDNAGRCQCNPNGYRAVNDQCVKIEPPNPSTTSSPAPSGDSKPPASSHSESSALLHIAWVSTLLISFSAGLIYLSMKYRWMERIRKLASRNYNTVLVNGIHDDDPIT